MTVRLGESRRLRQATRHAPLRTAFMLLPTFFGLFTLQGCGPAPAPSPSPSPSPSPAPAERRASSVVKVPGWPDLAGKVPLSFGIKAGDMVYASGLQGMDMRSMKLAEGGVAAETTQTLRNLQELLEAAGSSLQDVVRCSVSLTNLTRDFQAMNGAYASFWPKDPPARVAVQVKALAGKATVEIQCDAAIAGRGRKVVKVPGFPDLAAKGFPLSFATEAAGMVYLSGSQGMNMTTGKLVSGGVGPETTQTMQNLLTVLKAAGSSRERIVACSISLRNMSDFGEMNAAYKAFFQPDVRQGEGGAPVPLPSRVCVQADLAGAAAVEIECTAVGRDGKVPKVITVPGWPQRESFPFSTAVVGGGIAYISGMQGADMEKGTLVPGGAGPETTQALRNIASAAEASGTSLSEVTSCEVSLASMADFADMNKAYAAFWPKDAPSRVAVQVGALARGAAVELRCQAAVPPPPPPDLGRVVV